MNNFLAFWHTFGPHGREKPEEIIARKRREIGRNKGWTLWSFRYMKPQTIETWISKIPKNQKSVLVLCSASKNAIDPCNSQKTVNKKKIPEAKVYKEYKNNKWQDWLTVPDTINVPHPWSQKGLASAFKVSKILLPTENDKINCKFDWLSINPIIWKSICKVKWFCVTNKLWRSDNIPTRGEYLLKPGNGTVLRPIRAVLELMDPYIVEISRDRR